MTPKQEAFVREYLLDLNATAAYRRAGYKSGNPDVCGPRLLGTVGIAKSIQVAMEERSQRTEITQDRVLREIAHTAFLDPLDLFRADGTLKPLTEMPEHARRCIAGIEVEEIFEGSGKDRTWIGHLKKIRLVSKEGMVTLAGKHLKLFTDKTEVTGADGKDLFSPDQVVRMAEEIKAKRGGK